MRDFHLPGRSAAFGTNGAVATSHPLASVTALDILRQGGNAADAAVAAAVLLGVCEPQMTSLGGDCFVLLSPAGGDEVLALNGSGRAPAAFTADALRRDGHAAIPADRVEAVTLPGAVDAFCRLSVRWGRLGLERVLAPAISAFDEGVPVAPRVAFDWARAAENLQGAARRHYLDGGQPPRIGAVFRAPGQAEVLRRIARDGRSAFYEGEVAADMIAALRAAGGAHDEADFAAVACDEAVPVSATYGDLEIVEHPPNGQGAIALLLLNILKSFDIASMDPWGAERAHIEAEATKLAYDARNRHMADPAHMTRLAHLLDQATADALAALIDPDRAAPDPAALSEAVHRDTVYLCVVDRDGMAVSLIYSIFRSFGSGLASDRFGILFHNRGSGFTLTRGHPNEAAPGKRPMHTIIPGMIRRAGRVVMPFGVMGGPYQAAGHARFVSNLVDFGLDPQAAIDGPRCFADQGALRVERGYAPAVRKALAGKGHAVEVPDEPIGGAQAIMIRENGVLEAASDPRKDGVALAW